MKPRFCLPLLVCFLTLSPAALASTKWYVDGVNGSDSNNCKSRQHACKTIGHAISLATSGDAITIAASIYTENINIPFSLTIVGSGDATTIFDGGGVNTVVTISNTGAHVSLSKVTIRNGSAGAGGGINNSGTLTVSNSTLSENTVYGFGGGIWNGGTLTINNSTLSGNGVVFFFGPRGGGIWNGGTLTINNSTLSGNSECCGSGGRGGGISNLGVMLMSNSTLSGNRATRGGHGGGISNGGTATLQNSIVANSPSGGNCDGTITSNGHNLSSDSTCSFNNTGDLNNTNPNLGPLQRNGGPTRTMALLPGSPAIDTGNPGGCTDSQGHPLKTDQRGAPRPDHEDSVGCDRGAYELQGD
jgi:hypothetical protein